MSAKRLHTTVTVRPETQKLLKECVVKLNEIKSDEEPRYIMADLTHIAATMLHDQLVKGKACK